VRANYARRIHLESYLSALVPMTHESGSCHRQLAIADPTTKDERQQMTKMLTDRAEVTMLCDGNVPAQATHT
jgi:hypothetical protein